MEGRDLRIPGNFLRPRTPMAPAPYQPIDPELHRTNLKPIFHLRSGHIHDEIFVRYCRFQLVMPAGSVTEDGTETGLTGMARSG